ncbi:MAG: EAL domain-containing protein [Hyphomicrobiales bacterium]|nr:EAL domain-containing protein [Hyphomicrobiales bacterium]
MKLLLLDVRRNGPRILPAKLTPIDEATIKLTQRIADFVRPPNQLGFLGPGKFLIAQPANTTCDEILALTCKLESEIAKPIETADGPAHFACEIAPVQDPAPLNTYASLQRRAELALMCSLWERSNPACLGDAAPCAQDSKDMRALNDMKDALETGQFTIHYQPIINARTQGVDVYEALVRWRSPHAGMIAPAQFIPLAERSGLINDLGDWVLNQACRDIAGLDATTKIAVNVSRIQLCEDDIVSRIETALTKSGLAPHRLVVEITETSIAQLTPDALEKIHAVRNMGVAIAIDDFGSGYSSLAFFSSLPADWLKFDHALIANARRSERGRAIVRAFAALAREIGVVTVAEGVKSQEDVAMLGKIGVDYLQGFFFGTPAEAELAFGAKRLALVANRRSC